MKLTADKKGNLRYFSAKLSRGERFDSREIDMLSAKAVPMLIPPESIQGRKNNVLRYNISSYTTLEFYLSCVLSREQFAQLLLQCIELFRQMQRVYLNYKNLVLAFDWIYMSLADRSIHFIYLPLEASRLEASIPGFFTRMLRAASRSTYEQICFLDGCLAWLNQPAAFSLDAFEAYIRKCAAVPEPAPGSQPLPPDVRRTPEPAPDRVYRGQMPNPFPQVPVPAPAPAPASAPAHADYPITPTLSPDYDQGGTVRLMPGAIAPPADDSFSRPRFYIIRLQNGERVAITTSPFMVGTGAVSYKVLNNAAVSRYHASFSVQGGKCYITDQKSTNQTYVNGQALAPFEPRLLADGDKICLGNEEFVFSQEG